MIRVPTRTSPQPLPHSCQLLTNPRLEQRLAWRLLAGILCRGLGPTLGPIDEPAPEAAAYAGSERGDLGGVTLGIGSKRGGLLQLVG